MTDKDYIRIWNETNQEYSSQKGNAADWNRIYDRKIKLAQMRERAIHRNLKAKATRHEIKKA